MVTAAARLLPYRLKLGSPRAADKFGPREALAVAVVLVRRAAAADDDCDVVRYEY